jgi:predicted AlkP superfamily phosphohydrolase/phosphomutase
MERGSYETIKFGSRRDEFPSFWQLLSDAGRRVAVTNVPYDCLTKDLNGCQVVDWAVHNANKGVLTTPGDLASEIVERYGDDPVGRCDHYNPSPDEVGRLVDRLESRVESKADFASRLLDRGGWDLFLVTFDESHCVGHQCWHLHDPRHPLHDRTIADQLGDPVERVYRAIDKAIGRLLDRIGPETTVMLFSGTGMGPNYGGNHVLDDILARLDDSGLDTGRLVVRSLRKIWGRIPPRLRARYRRTSRKMEQRLLLRSRSNRHAFAVLHNDISGAVRINVVGREPHGRVRPGPEFETFCEQLTRDLLDVENLDTGEPLIADVVRTEDLYPGDHAGDFADLFVVWNRSGPVTTVGSKKIGRITRPFVGNRTGDHTAHGLVMAAGPGLQAGYREGEVSVLSIAPTVVSWLGLTWPDAQDAIIPALARNGMA